MGIGKFFNETLPNEANKYASETGVENRNMRKLRTAEQRTQMAGQELLQQEKANKFQTLKQEYRTSQETYNDRLKAEMVNTRTGLQKAQQDSYNAISAAIAKPIEQLKTFATYEQRKDFLDRLAKEATANQDPDQANIYIGLRHLDHSNLTRFVNIIDKKLKYGTEEDRRDLFKQLKTIMNMPASGIMSWLTRYIYLENAKGQRAGAQAYKSGNPSVGPFGKVTGLGGTVPQDPSAQTNSSTTGGGTVGAALSQGAQGGGISDAELFIEAHIDAMMANPDMDAKEVGELKLLLSKIKNQGLLSAGRELNNYLKTQDPNFHAPEIATYIRAVDSFRRAAESITDGPIYMSKDILNFVELTSGSVLDRDGKQVTKAHLNKSITKALEGTNGHKVWKDWNDLGNQKRQKEELGMLTDKDITKAMQGYLATHYGSFFNDNGTIKTEQQAADTTMKKHMATLYAITTAKGDALKMQRDIATYRASRSHGGD